MLLVRNVARSPQGPTRADGACSRPTPNLDSEPAAECRTSDQWRYRMTTRSIPSNRPNEAGTDYRIPLWERRDQDYADSFAAWPNGVTSGGTDTTNISREAEVQAFRPTTSGGGRSQTVVIVVRIASPSGDASLMVSKTEAQEIALALMSAVNDAGRLEVAAYVSSLGDVDVASFS